MSWADAPAWSRSLPSLPRLLLIPIWDQEQPVPILIGAGIRQSRPDRYRREFAHRIYPHTLRHQNVGQADLSSHSSPHLASAACARQRTPVDGFGDNKLGLLGFQGTTADAPGGKNSSEERRVGKEGGRKG